MIRGASGWRRTGILGAGALVVCAVLALRGAAAEVVTYRLDRRLILNELADSLAWIALYYLMWVALTPFVFFLARRVPLGRKNGFRPFLFHVPVSVVISTAAPLLLAIVFGGLVLQRGWPDLQDLATPFWTDLIIVRAISDTPTYWLLLVAGTALATYDDYQAKRLLAADLERSLVTAQVDALKMKLQPHFLFNTLNSVSFLALEKDTAAIATKVERLGNLLGASMSSNGRQEVPLKEELELLDEYLAIEEVRFKDRLRVSRRVDPALEHARFPSLTLQPIVENSIKHGFSRRLDASRIDLTIDREGDSLRVVVRDDGPGLPPGFSLDTHCGRGLRNVIARLDALYRGAWSFSLENAPGGGTISELRVPYSDQPAR